MRARSTPGPPLPYRPLAGVVPCGSGWLLAPGRLQGINLHPLEPELLGSLLEVLDYRPGFEIVALGCPVGLPTETQAGGRACDGEARRILGRPRNAAVASAPGRTALNGAGAHARLSAAVRNRLPRITEVDAAIAPYWQRTVFEVHPELSFHQLNGDAPLRWSKHTQAGQDERRSVLTSRMPGIDRVIDASLLGAHTHQLLDVAACLWTARRLAARAVSRVPEVPEWDDLGLRMEIVR